MDYNMVQDYTKHDGITLISRINALKNFDLDKNMTQTDGLTFAKRLIAQCCDEKGNQITEGVALTMIKHFHHYMAAMAWATYSDHIYELIVKGGEGIPDWCIVNFAPYYYIDRVWKLLILDTNLYKEYIFTLDTRIYDRTIGYEHFKRGIGTFWMMRNIYSSSMFEDSYCSYFTSFDQETEAVFYGETKLSRNEIETVKNFIAANPDEIGYYPYLDMIKKVQKEIAKKYDSKTFEIDLIPSSDVIEPIPNFDLNEVKKELDIIQDLDFTADLLTTFILDYSLDEKFAKNIFVEYSKFLVMMKLSDYNLCPGFWVDMLWHTHMQATKLYRDFSFAYYGKMMGHIPSNFSQEHKDLFEQCHNHTLQIYGRMFGTSINKQIWCDFTYSGIENKLMDFNIFLYLISETPRAQKQSPLYPIEN